MRRSSVQNLFRKVRHQRGERQSNGPGAHRMSGRIAAAELLVRVRTARLILLVRHERTGARELLFCGLHRLDDRRSGHLKETVGFRHVFGREFNARGLGESLHRFCGKETCGLMTWTTLMTIIQRWWDNGGVNISIGDPCHVEVH